MSKMWKALIAILAVAVAALCVCIPMTLNKMKTGGAEPVYVPNDVSATSHNIKKLTGIDVDVTSVTEVPVAEDSEPIAAAIDSETIVEAKDATVELEAKEASDGAKYTGIEYD